MVVLIRFCHIVYLPSFLLSSLCIPFLLLFPLITLDPFPLVFSSSQFSFYFHASPSLFFPIFLYSSTHLLSFWFFCNLIAPFTSCLLLQDVQTIDIDYMLRFRDFTIDPVNWGDLPALAQELHNENVKLTLILVISMINFVKNNLTDDRH